MPITATGLLLVCGADTVDHPGGTLLAHLRRVRQVLADWGARPALQQAGMCHAMYGTDGFPAALLDLSQRCQLREVIGDEAERIVYLYASCDRRVSYPGLPSDQGVFRDRFTGREFCPEVQERRDFAELTAANELDIARISPEFRAEYGATLRALLTRLRPLMSPFAWHESEVVLH